jgi:hypothetical protein
MHKGAELHGRPDDSWLEIYGKVEFNIEEICPGEGSQPGSYHEIQGWMRAAYTEGMLLLKEDRRYAFVRWADAILWKNFDAKWQDLEADSSTTW